MSGQHTMFTPDGKSGILQEVTDPNGKIRYVVKLVRPVIPSPVIQPRREEFQESENSNSLSPVPYILDIEEGDSTKKSASAAAKNTAKQFVKPRNKWTPVMVHAMIDYFGENKKDLSEGNCQTAWDKFVLYLSEEHSLETMTSTVCRNKWTELKSKYKEEKIKMETSGMGVGNPDDCDEEKAYTGKWQFFEAMHEHLARSPEVNPVATCSNSRGHRIKSVSESNTEETKKVVTTPGRTKRKSICEEQLERRYEQRERHHQEKMACIERHNRLTKLICERIDPSAAVLDEL